MLNHRPIPTFDAIRQGFDDRLLAFVEYDPAASVTLDMAAECIHAWRRLFEDDLEIAAFVRIGSTLTSTNDRADRTEEQCAAVRAIATHQLPVAVAVLGSAGPCDSSKDPAQADDDSTDNREQWTLCESDFRSLLIAIHVPADVLLCAFDRSLAPRASTMQPFPGLRPTASRAERSAFVSEFARGVAMRGDMPLGIVLSPFDSSDVSCSLDAQRLLGVLADAAYHRRIQYAA